MRILNSNTLIMEKDLFFLEKVYTFYSFIIPNIAGDCGIILPLDKNKNFDIDLNIYEYYRLIIKDTGIIFLEKKTNDIIVILQKSY